MKKTLAKHIPVAVIQLSDKDIRLETPTIEQIEMGVLEFCGDTYVLKETRLVEEFVYIRKDIPKIPSF